MPLTFLRHTPLTMHLTPHTICCTRYTFSPYARIVSHFYTRCAIHRTAHHTPQNKNTTYTINHLTLYTIHHISSYSQIPCTMRLHHTPCTTHILHAIRHIVHASSFSYTIADNHSFVPWGQPWRVALHRAYSAVFRVQPCL